MCLSCFCIPYSRNTIFISDHIFKDVHMQLALKNRENVSFKNKGASIIFSFAQMGKSTLKRGMVIYRFAWSSYHVQCLFPPCTMSISNPSFLSMIRPLTAQCSCTPDYRLSIKIALLSADPALGGVFTLCLQQNH